MAADGGRSVLVIGAGPSGLAVTACLKQAGVACDLVDRGGACGGAYRALHAEMMLLSPARYTQLPGLPIQSAGEYVRVAEYRTYLEEYVRHFDLVAEHREVSAIEAGEHGFRVHFADLKTMGDYRVVVVAAGMVDCPSLPDVPGLSLQRGDVTAPQTLHSRDWPGAQGHAGRRVLVVGGGMSGVEIAEECAFAGIDVAISSRRAIRPVNRRLLGRDVHHWVHLVSHLLPLWAFGSFCDRLPALPSFDRGFRKMTAAGRISVRPELRRVDGTCATFSDGTSADFDSVVCATGYRFETPFLPTEVRRGARGQPVLSQNESVSWPGLFFIGYPCGRIFPSEFLRGIALDAPRVARRICRVLN